MPQTAWQAKLPRVAREYWTECVVVIVLFTAMHVPLVFEAFNKAGVLNSANAGQYGDFVGGYFGTIFLLASGILLLLTFRHQLKEFQHQNFVARYFELIKMHRDNVSEMEIGEVTGGRRIFVKMFREYREILKVARELQEQQNCELTKEQLLVVSFYCLFFGTGPNSSRMLQQALNDYGIDPDYTEALDHRLSDDDYKRKVDRFRNLDYKPFEGHQSRLGHYFRHLFQTVCFVHKQTIDIDKYDYVKTIRAQLSTHEQALLLVNSLAPIGEEWHNQELIHTYRLVKNIPHNFFDADTELDVATLEFGGTYFEWQEVAAAKEAPVAGP